MALAMNVVGSRFKATPRGQLDALIGSIQLVEIGQLRPYETPDPIKVEEISNSLRTSGILINPVIVDPVRSLLIDGHHRVQALQDLGLSMIPAFAVDYLSENVTVRGWSRTTTAQADDLLGFLGELKSSGGQWGVVVASSQRGEIESVQFPTPAESAAHLDWLNLRLKQKGHIVSLATEADAIRSGLIHSYISPVIGKDEVLDIVSKGKVFPYEVNRHLISDRPLELRAPLDAIVDHSLFRRYLDWLRQESNPLSISAGFRHGGRVYDERVILLCGSGEGSSTR